MLPSSFLWAITMLSTMTWIVCPKRLGPRGTSLQPIPVREEICDVNTALGYVCVAGVSPALIYLLAAASQNPPGRFIIFSFLGTPLRDLRARRGRRFGSGIICDSFFGLLCVWDGVATKITKG